MRNRLLFWSTPAILASAVLVAAAPASAGLFGKKDKPAGLMTNMAPAVQTGNSLPFHNTPFI